MNFLNNKLKPSFTSSTDVASSLRRQTDVGKHQFTRGNGLLSTPDRVFSSNGLTPLSPPHVEANGLTPLPPPRVAVPEKLKPLHKIADCNKIQLIGNRSWRCGWCLEHWKVFNPTKALHHVLKLPFKGMKVLFQLY